MFAEEGYFERHSGGAIYYDGEWHGVEFFAFLHADAYDQVLYNTEIQGDDGRQRYLDYIKEHAGNYRNIDLKPEDSFLALSTCTEASTNGRHILVGRITGKLAKDLFNP